MPGTIALNFSNLKHFKNVRLIHDTVMGGRSDGLLTRLAEPAGLRFEGHLSLANNGGFASAEFALAQALPAVEFRTLELAALADGRKYQLRLKTPFIPQGVAYVAEFQSSSQLQRYQFEPFNFRGQFRGRLVTGLPALNFSDVSHISLMLADSNQGTFAIELFTIQFSALQSI
ncbi:CIA30 family protein [Arsukibacterium sp.]|uniref:CIA30 family protein n=1 Tax=Arsukibacterium sp. TaxID=1977258 RepID=UPI002FDA643E